MQFTSISDLLGNDGQLSPIGLKAALRLSIAAQEDAVSLYEQIAGSTKDPQISKLMLDIANEQKVHIGQFKKLLNDRDSDNFNKQQQGQSQARKKLGSESQDDKLRAQEQNRMRTLRGV